VRGVVLALTVTPSRFSRVLAPHFSDVDRCSYSASWSQ
jgi:hypothetical protein